MFIATIGKEVNKTKVEASGTEAQKNLCTAASGNVCQAGKAGSGLGQFKEPKGVAATTGGNLLVADTGNNRVQKISPEGEYLAKIGSEGSAAGQLKEPMSVAISSTGNIWVADTGNNRVQEWSSTFEYLRQVGVEGSGEGQFSRPDSIEIDADGTIWVADQNARISRLGEAGAYLSAFGIAGTGAGQFGLGSVIGLASSPNGTLWVADRGNNRIQKWIKPGSVAGQHGNYDRRYARRHGGRPLLY